MSDITKPRYCLCPNANLFRNGQKRYCRHCWSQPIPPYVEHTMPPDVLTAWVQGSIKQGMDIPRICRDLGVGRVNVMQVLEGRGNETATMGKAN